MNNEQPMGITPIISLKEPLALSECDQCISREGVVIFPTDTIYGIGCTAFQPKPIERIFAIKGRDFKKALPILIGSPEQIQLVASECDHRSKRLMQTFWPGPLTIILPKHTSLPPNLSPYDTVGIRMPNHPWLIELLKLTGPLAATSANPSGSPEARNVAEAVLTMDGKINLIIDGGQSSSNLPSTVVDCRSLEIKVLREGPISKVDIFAALK
jgi:L-threonylcarbamoyladenylate synthase